MIRSFSSYGAKAMNPALHRHSWAFPIGCRKVTWDRWEHDCWIHLEQAAFREYIYIIVYIIPSIPLFKYPYKPLVCYWIYLLLSGSCDQAFNGFEKHQRTWSPGCLAHPLDVRKFPSNVRPCWVSNKCCSLRCKSLLAGKVPLDSLLSFIQSPFLGIHMSAVPIWAVSTLTHIFAGRRHVSKPVTEPENPLTPDDWHGSKLSSHEATFNINRVTSMKQHLWLSHAQSMCICTIFSVQMSAGCFPSLWDWTTIKHNLWRYNPILCQKKTTLVAVSPATLQPSGTWRSPVWRTRWSATPPVPPGINPMGRSFPEESPKHLRARRWKWLSGDPPTPSPNPSPLPGSGDCQKGTPPYQLGKNVTPAWRCIHHKS